MVHIHAGFGDVPGSAYRLVAEAKAAEQRSDSTVLAEVLDFFGPRRPLWQLMWGGVLDRFPRLRFTFAEVHCDWVPETLLFLDQYAEAHRGSMKLKPSEYWQQNFAIGASIMRYTDVAARHEIGLKKFMFGTDFPHLESTWPNTWDFIRTTMRDLSEYELRAVLGGNMIEWYGLDGHIFEETAFRHGPLPEELLGDHYVDPRVIDHFHVRSGLRNPVSLYPEKLRDTVNWTSIALPASMPSVTKRASEGEATHPVGAAAEIYGQTNRRSNCDRAVETLFGGSRKALRLLVSIEGRATLLRKAEKPSDASGLKNVSISRASDPSKMGCALRIQWLRERLVHSIACWGPVARRSAISIACGTTWSTGTVFVTSPIRSASRPSMKSPVIK